MEITERKEKVQDRIIEIFSELVGLRGGVESDTVVYARNAQSLFLKLCEAFKIKAAYCSGLVTIDDYTEHFLSLMDKKDAQLKVFYKNLQSFVKEQIGWYELDDTLFEEYLPVSADPTQNLREEMTYFIKLGRLKNKIRSKYGYYHDSSEFSNARTLRKIGEVIFWPFYKAE